MPIMLATMDAAKKIYVGFGSGGIAIINASDGKQVGSIKLSAHPEAFQLEKKGSRIFVNVPNSRHVAVVDRDKGKVVATWRTDLAFCEFSRWHLMKRIIDCLSAAAFHPGWSCSTQIRAMLLQRPISPAIATISSTIRSASVYTRSAEREKSTSSTKSIQIPIESQPRSVQRMALVPDFLFRNATSYS